MGHSRPPGPPSEWSELLLPGRRIRVVRVGIGLVGLMMADYTASRRAELAMACHVAGDAADDGSFDAALGFGPSRLAGNWPA